MILGFLIGLGVYVFIRVVATGFYTVKPNGRAVITSFGRARDLVCAWVPSRRPHPRSAESWCTD